MNAVTFFVGRRPLRLPEVYALSGAGVERLRPEDARGSAPLDWQGGAAPVMELSRALLSRLTGRAPSRRLAARFAVRVLMDLPVDGFVLDAEAIWDWVVSSSEPDEWSPPDLVERS